MARVLKIVTLTVTLLTLAFLLIYNFNGPWSKAFNTSANEVGYQYAKIESPNNSFISGGYSSLSPQIFLMVDIRLSPSQTV